ncbi:MAG: hypothetical protein ACKO23_06385 [Gemmataceae bacterium]
MDGKSRQGSRGFRLSIAQRFDDLQHFAPGGEGSTIRSLVLIHGFHENNFFVGIFFFAGGWVYLTSSFANLSSVFAASPFHGNGDVLFSAIIAQSPFILLGQSIFGFPNDFILGCHEPAPAPIHPVGAIDHLFGDHYCNQTQINNKGAARLLSKEEGMCETGFTP